MLNILSDQACLFAAKSDLRDNRKWLPLWMHLYDTVFVMDYLQENWISSVYMGANISVDEIKKAGIFVAAVHDIGKITPAFQSLISKKIEEYCDVLEKNDFYINKNFTEDERSKYGHHSKNGALLLNYFGVPREIAVVVAAHHGKIPSRGYTDEYSSDLVQHEELFWEKMNREKWRGAQQEYIDFALKIAGYKEIEELPHINKKTQMLLSGLLIMADWLASNQKYFPTVDIDAQRDVLIGVYPQRGNKGVAALEFPQKWTPDRQWENVDLVKAKFNFSANAVQKEVQKIVGEAQGPELVIIEAPMGNGKTEASLAAAEIFAQKMKKSGLAFFLPSQATSNALFTRLEEWAKKQTNGNKLALQLAHGSFLINKDFESLQDGTDDEGNSELIAHQFFCGNKSFLLANFVVGTVDQLLMAAIKQKHVMLKHLGLADKVVIIDECHAYDAYMNTYLDRILKFLRQYGVPVIILSATLPAIRRIELLQAYSSDIDSKNHPLREEISYPLISWTDGDQIGYTAIKEDSDNCQTILIDKISEEEITKKIQECSEDGACVGVILNTVSKAQKLAAEVDKVIHKNIILYHAQYLMTDRVNKEQGILNKTGKQSSFDERKGVIVIGTQVLEQSLDIDFDVLITEVCPMDLLLQRIGRLHRHCRRSRPEGYVSGKCYIVGADADNLDKGSKAIYGEYLLRKTIKLLPERLSLPQDISVLVQKTYDGQPGDAELEDAYKKFCFNSDDQRQRATSFLLNAITYGKRIPPTIEGLSGNEISDDSAKLSVRDGDPSIEVIVVKEINDNSFAVISGNLTDKIFSYDDEPDAEICKEIAGQKLRLPHILSNHYNAASVIDSLRAESDTKMGKIQKSPWLHNELFLILDDNSEKQIMNKYSLKYSYEYGLMVTEGSKKNG